MSVINFCSEIEFYCNTKKCGLYWYFFTRVQQHHIDTTRLFFERLICDEKSSLSLLYSLFELERGDDMIGGGGSGNNIYF